MPGPLLAVETSTVVCSVAASNGDVVAVRKLHEPGAHAARIMPMIDEVLDEVGITMQDVAGVVFGRGPGSFTGVRIAVALTQGLAAGIGVPVLGVSSLALVAQQALDLNSGARVLVVQDARMGELYAGRYAADDAGLARALEPELLVAPGALVSAACDIAVGGAIERLPELRDRFEQQGLAMAPEVAEPAAADALRVAATAAEADWTPAEAAQAVYLRQRVASPKSA